MVKVKLVAFDNNGTALDDLHVAYASARRTFELHDLISPTQDQYRNEINSRWEEFYRRHGFDMLPQVTANDLNDLRREYCTAHGHEAHYRPGLQALLEKLNGYTWTVMVSAEIESVLYEQLGREGLVKWFDFIKAEAWPKTPSLVRMLVQTQVMPEEAVYIDDSVEGITAAKAIGMRTIGFVNPTAYNSRDRIVAAKPDDIAVDFEEARTILESWGAFTC